MQKWCKQTGTIKIRTDPLKCFWAQLGYEFGATRCFLSRKIKMHMFFSSNDMSLMCLVQKSSKWSQVTACRTAPGFLRVTAPNGDNIIIACQTQYLACSTKECLGSNLEALAHASELSIRFLQTVIWICTCMQVLLHVYIAHMVCLVFGSETEENTHTHHTQKNLTFPYLITGR